LLDDGTNRILAGWGKMGKVDEHLYESKFPRRKRTGYGKCFARKPTVFIATLIFSLRAAGNLPDRD
jgi:hypothetical protein